MSAADSSSPSAPALNVVLDSLIPADDPGRVPEPDEVYLAFSEWAESTGRPLYPHQDEALSQILSDRHVIAATPTGSGKSMIALAAHTASLARGGRSYYTAPLKALVSEKFFELVRLFGADNVGMITGDTSINAAAPIICCTAEILANQSLREGEDMDVDCVVMDEFHYYADPQRGWAWQVPLLELPQAQMVLLSATLGDVSFFVRDLRERTGREVAVVDDAVTAATKEQLTYQGFLAELLLAEVDDRDRRSTLRRIKSAGFPREKWLADFDFTANPNINPATINELATGDWIRRGDPLCLIGDSGTGKSHLLIALGTAAAEQGYRVRYTLATRLVNELVEAADEKQLTKTINRYGRVDLLVIDELGYLELDRRGAKLLFQVLTEREEKNAIAIASSQSFSAWTDTDPRLCAAIVDRLTYNATIIETGTNSYRLAHTRARASVMG